MGHPQSTFLCLFFLLCALYKCSAIEAETNQTTYLVVDASEGTGRKASETLFGIFFEEINHAGAGGIWAELVSNRGFEAGGKNTPSNINPWTIIGDESSIIVSTDRSSRFERNKVALWVEVLCDTTGSNVCPAGGVGISNPGYWGMNIEQEKRGSLGSINQLSVTLGIMLAYLLGLFDIIVFLVMDHILE